MEVKKWKVAVIGCGAFANAQYFPNIAKEANAVCVAACDIVPQNAQKACEKYGIPEWYASVEELLDKCDFDIAIDAASIQAHHEINMAVLGAGKHLISQKPAAPTVEMLTEQMELAQKMGVKFACVPIHPMRFDLGVAKDLISKGAIGNAYYAKCTMAHGGPEYYTNRSNDPSWFYEPGAGALVDMGVHGLQIVTSVFGPAKRMACMAKVTTPVRIVRTGTFDGKVIQSDKLPDQYIITLDFGNEKMALVDTGFAEKASKTPALEIFGEQGTMSFVQYFMNNAVPEMFMDCPERGIRGWITPAAIGSHRPLKSQCCCLRDIIEAIEQDREPVLSAAHARHVLEIMCKVPEAIATGGTIELTTTF